MKKVREILSFLTLVTILILPVILLGLILENIGFSEIDAFTIAVVPSIMHALIMYFTIYGNWIGTKIDNFWKTKCLMLVFEIKEKK